MGTNYYLRPKPCPTCGHRETKKHIGKSSHGWQFHFRGYPHECIVSYKDWLSLINDEKKQIVDEDGDVMPLNEFKALIASKKDGLNHYNIITDCPITKAEKEYVKESPQRNCQSVLKYTWKDNEGNTFTDNEFC